MHFKALPITGFPFGIQRALIPDERRLSSIARRSQSQAFAGRAIGIGFLVKIAQILVVLSLLGCLMGCGYLASQDTGPPNIRPQEPNVVSLNPDNWYILYSSGMPPNPSSDIPGAWSFEFPS